MTFDFGNGQVVTDQVRTVAMPLARAAPRAASTEGAEVGAPTG